MPSKLLMDVAAGVPRLPVPEPPVRVVIAYDDLAAGKRAMQVLGDIARSLGEEIQFEPMPWSFDLLEDTDWREVAASEAVKADILVIASSSSCSQLPSDVGRWTESAIQRKRGTAAAVIALFGPEDRPDRTGSPRLEFIQRAAREAGLEFFAPAPRSEWTDPLAEIRRRSQTITPLPKEILQHPGGAASTRKKSRS